MEQFPPQCHAASEGPAWALVGGGGGVMVVTTCRGWGSKETAKAVGPQEGGLQRGLAVRVLVPRVRARLRVAEAEE